MTRARYQARLLWNPSKNRDVQFDLSLVHDQSGGTPYGSARAINGLDLFDRKNLAQHHARLPRRPHGRGPHCHLCAAP
jgi:hypothetical protein